MTDNLKRRKTDRLLFRIFTYIQRFFFVIGLSVTLSLVLMFLSLSRIAEQGTTASLPDKILLTYAFSDPLSEAPTHPSLSKSFFRSAPMLHEVVAALDGAAADPRVTGFVAKLEDAQFNLAQIQELRDALARFRQAGKFAYIYGDTFSGGGGMGGYYLATAFDEIWMQPVGSVAINGIGAQVPFFKGLLDKVGVQADFVHKGIYKSAPESLTETRMTPPVRKMTEELVGNISAQILFAISQGRGIVHGDLLSLVDNSPFTDKAALDAKLVTHVGYLDTLLDTAKEKTAGKDTKPVDLMAYHAKSDTVSFNKRKMPAVMGGHGARKIALVYGVGEIVAYDGRDKSGFTEDDMAANKLVAALRAAREDKDVAAIVFRIDSPGGDPSAAESIRRAVVQAREKGKPVIVSMGGAAASGGYWVASAADKIVAQPATLTGSIGVFGGKFVAAELFNKIGVSFETVKESKNADMWTATRAFTPDERRKFDENMGAIYDAFITRVAEGRKITPEKVEAVAQGRVWTGAQAKDAGLVDELGGLDVAMKMAKEAAGLAPDQPVKIDIYPPKKSPLELFKDLASEGMVLQPSIKIDISDVLPSSAGALVMPDMTVR